MKKFLLATFLMLSFASVGLCTTQDGVIDTSSTGTIDISVTIPKMILINGLGSFNLSNILATEFRDAPTSSDAGRTESQDICVTSNMHQGEFYSVKAYDNGGGTGVFQLRNTETGNEADALVYTVGFKDYTLANYVQLTYDTAKTQTFTSDGDGFQDTCVTPNAHVQIQFSKQVLHNAYHGTYTGTLTLVVAPE